MRQLYPLKFNPILKDKIWGGDQLNKLFKKKGASATCGESWEISDVNNDVSVVSNGFLKGNNLNELVEIYMGDLVGEKVYEEYGNNFPLLIKLIDAKDKLSVQVHPDDKMAEKEHNCPGKTEMWYVMYYEPEAELICGFNQPVSKETYLKHVSNNTLTEILNSEKVRTGDVYFLPAGRIHAIGAGIVILEIEQPSDITYRIFDWNRTDDKGNPRQLHTELAAKAIDYNYYPNYKTDYRTVLNSTVEIVDCPYFFTSILTFDKTIEKDYYLLDSFVIYCSVEGSFTLQTENSEPVVVAMGESVLLPAMIKSVSLVPIGLAKVLEVYINKQFD
jgi:mannose-6-phosphate isomerase